MCAQWLKEYKPDLVLRKLQDTRVTEGARVSFSTALFDDFLEVLISSIKFNSQLPKTIIRGIVLKSLFQASSTNKFSHSSVIKQISLLEREYLKQSQKKFFVTGTLSIRSRNLISSIRSPQRTIRFGGAVPRRILERDPQYHQIFMQAVNPVLPRGYTRFAISASGRTIHEAGQSGLNEFDLYRALWNLCLNRNQINRSSSGRISPINRIVLGPLSTIFTESFTLVEETWWEDHEYDRPEDSYDVLEMWEVLRAFEKSARARINMSSCGELIRAALILYVNALDRRNYEAVFLKLWCVLEKLTLTERANYDLTIRRASFLWEDHDYHREVLFHLKESRNRFVHQDEFGNRGEVLVYQLKRYVESLLVFHISRGSTFSNLQEIGSFLDLPKTRSSLEEKNRLIKRAIKYRTS